METKISYTKENLAAAQEALKKLAASEGEITKTKLIEILKPEILEARAAGKSFKQIEETLRNANIFIPRQMLCCALKNKENEA